MLRDLDMLGQCNQLGGWLQGCEQTVLLIDAGGVLFNNVIEDSSFIADVALLLDVDADDLLAEYVSRDSDFESNRVGMQQVIFDCARRLRGHTPNSDMFVRIDALYLAATEHNERMFSALKTARGNGKLLVLANNEAEHWDRIKNDVFGHFCLFDFHASSWRVGNHKPTPQYFAKLDQLLWPTPRTEWHLLDDNPQVLVQARKQGVFVTRYTAGICSDDTRGSKQ